MKIFNKISLIAISVVIFLLLLLVLAKTTNNIGEQTLFFLKLIAIILPFIFFGFISNYKNIKVGIIDVLVFLFFGYFLIHHFVVEGVYSETKFAIINLFFPAYLGIRIINNHRFINSIIFYSFILSSFYLSILTISQLLGFEQSNHGLFKATGTFYNPGQLGGYLSILITFCGYYTLQEQVKIKEYIKNKEIVGIAKYSLAFTATILMLMIIPSTNSRAGFIALFVCSILYLYKEYSKKLVFWTKEHKKLSSVIVILVITLFAVGYNMKKDSANGRLLIWKIALTNIEKENVIFGVGCGNFAGKYGEYQENYFTQENRDSSEIAIADSVDFAFNEYVSIFVEYGIIGLILFLGILFLVIRNLYNYNNLLMYPTIALLVFAFFSYPFSIIPFLIVLTVLISASDQYNRGIVFRIVYIPIIILSIIVSIYSIKNIKEKIDATKKWQELSMFYRMNIYDNLAQDYEDLHDLLSDNYMFLFEYGHILNKTKQYSDSNRVLKEGLKKSNDPMFLNVIGNNYKCLKNYDLAYIYYEKSNNRLPNRIYPLYLQMKLYEQTKQKDLLRDKAQQIINFKVKVKSTASREIKEEAQKHI